MTSDDLDWVSLAETQIYEFPWTHGNFADSLEAKHRAIVVRENADPVGYAVVMQMVDEAHLLNISILPNAQSGGRGTRLLEHLMADSREHAAVRMLLEVRRSNLRGQAFYLQHDFIKIGERRGYYPAHDCREDAIVMAREL
jgi:ribosomal-protein-alanine N-acetyltransferase